MRNDLKREARRNALAHAESSLLQATSGRGDPQADLMTARQMIAERGVPGEPGSEEQLAGIAERDGILATIDRTFVLHPRDLDPLAWMKSIIELRLAILFPEPRSPVGPTGSSQSRVTRDGEIPRRPRGIRLV